MLFKCFFGILEGLRQFFEDKKEKKSRAESSGKIFLKMLKSSILVELMSKNGQIIKNNPDFYINFSLYDFLQPKVEEIGQKLKKTFFFRNMKIFSKKKFTQKFPKKIPSISKVSDY